MSITRRSFIAAALAAVAAPLLGTTSRYPTCDGSDCGTVVDYDSWSTFRWYAVHYWPAENPQRYAAKTLDYRDGAQALVDAFHRGEV